MGWKETLLSSLVMLVIAAGLYELLQRRVIDINALGVEIAGTLTMAFLIVFWWGWHEPIEMWAKRRKELKEQPLVQVNQPEEQQNEELERLIKPLYCEFDKYRHATKNGLTGLVDALAYEKWLHVDDEYYKPIGIDRVEVVVDIMQKHGDSAQPDLHEKIHKYLELRQTQRNPNKQYGPREDDAIHEALNQIFALVEERYDELMWEERS